MKFARLVFLVAGIYGLAVLAPQYFLEPKVGEDHPAGLTHPEYFYGFLGVAIAWQMAFFVIAHDPQRFRPMIIPSIIEKFSFAAAAAVLYILQRVPVMILIAGLIDFMWGVLFHVAWQRLGVESWSELLPSRK